MGTRIKEESVFRPKPMVPIGKRPILWHIMRCYSKYGFRRFVLCLGFKGEQIKDYFLHYHSLNSDLTVELANNNVNIHPTDQVEDWEVTLVDTGENAMTGARLKKACRYLGDAEHLAVTYGDGLCNANLADEFNFHLSQNKIGTVLGVHPPSRFGELKVDGDQLSGFDEKPEFQDNWINGGFFFFQREFVDSYLSSHDDCVLERAPLSDLARDGGLAIYKHRGFWACMDTQRDRDYLNDLWDRGEAPWTLPVDFCKPCQAALQLAH